MLCTVQKRRSGKKKRQFVILNELIFGNLISSGLKINTHIQTFSPAPLPLFSTAAMCSRHFSRSKASASDRAAYAVCQFYFIL
jgi:hypothetical protein